MEEQTKYEVTEQPQMGLVQHGTNSIFMDIARFEFAQRVSQVFAQSTMVPEHFQNNVGNCMIALNLAERTGTDPFMLMQNMYIVHGRPGIEAKLAIALFNDGRTRFDPPLEYEIDGDDPKDDGYRCRAGAKLKGSDKWLKGEWIDWPLVKAEGWLDKKGSKWKSMPGQMFIYRAAMFFIRAYEPGVLLGLRTKDELDDIVIDVTPRKTLEPPTPPVETGADIYKVNGSDNPASGPEKADGPAQGAPITNEKEKPLFDRLKGARKNYCMMVIDNLDEIKTMPLENLPYLQGKWEDGRTDEPWPLRIPPDEQNDTQGQPDVVVEDEETGNADSGQDPGFVAAMRGYQAELGPPRFTRVLDRQGFKSFSDVPPEDMAMVNREMSAELDLMAEE